MAVSERLKQASEARVPKIVEFNLDHDLIHHMLLAISCLLMTLL